MLLEIILKISDVLCTLKWDYIVLRTAHVQPSDDHKVKCVFSLMH